MSRVNIGGTMNDNIDFDMLDLDNFAQLKHDLDSIDIPDSLNFENPDLMSSEFFDSVMSMEQSSTTSLENELEYSPENPIDDFGLNSDPEECRLTNSCTPDSEGSTQNGYELNEFLVLGDPLVCKPTSTEQIAKDLRITLKTNVDYKTNGDLLTVVKRYQNGVAKQLNIPISNRVVLNNTPSTKKVIVTKPANKKSPITNTKQILKVQSMSGKGRSVLLPFNVTKMKNIKIINGKELKAENLKITKIDVTPPKKNYVDSYFASSPEDIDDDSDSVEMKPDTEDRQYPMLILSEEEKRLLVKEGISLPTHYPLTKNEEKELKRIRRKIRNKISAQDSRKRKKEYVDGLEERIKQNAEEKKLLMNRVKQLQQQNNRLLAQMNKLQTIIFNSGSKVTPATSLMIVVISALLISLPNLRIPHNSSIRTDGEQQNIARRTLLSSQQATTEDTLHSEELLVFNKDEESELKSVVFDEDNNTEEYRMFNSRYKNMKNDFINDDKSKPPPWLDTDEIQMDAANKFGRMKNIEDSPPEHYEDFALDRNKFEIKNLPKRKFIEPDIDDEYPQYMTKKKIKTEDVYKTGTESNVLSATVSVNSSEKE